MLHNQLFRGLYTVFVNLVEAFWKIRQKIVEVFHVMCMLLCPDAIAGEVKL